MEIRCLIVDDEELALNVLEKYISSVPTLRLVGRCDNAIEAISFLHSHTVDLLFLDLNMPELSGLDMLKTLQNPPKIILTTAYSEYALESYEYGVVDYLLKPIKIERFIKAVNKVVELFGEHRGSVDNEEIISKPILIKEDQTTFVVPQADILYVEAYGNYLKIHTQEKTYLTRLTMQQMFSELSDTIFSRIHKSYIVNKQKVSRMMGNVVFISKIELPIGTTYKKDFMKAME
ncbi:MAG: DNA-binding response regulator [Bacteroidetes bacterium]|nr:DNA-binding response regulator [Bacteroidota bacterium]|tara:strand:- start:455 stop:1153 length:699 start_codon:yes stop_codon:yes gene_type:complete